MGSVIVGAAVVDAGVLAVEVPAVDVVDVAVAIVVDPGGLAVLAGIDPDVGLQVRVADHQPLVDDPHHHLVVATQAGVPQRQCAAAVGVGRRGGGALHAPQVVQIGVVGVGLALVDPVRLDEFHRGIGGDALEQPGAEPGRPAQAHAQQLAAPLAARLQTLQRLGAEAPQHQALAARRGLRAELHQQLVGDMRAAGLQRLAHRRQVAAGLGDKRQASKTEQQESAGRTKHGATLRAGSDTTAPPFLGWPVACFPPVQYSPGPAANGDRR